MGFFNFDPEKGNLYETVVTADLADFHAETASGAGATASISRASEDTYLLPVYASADGTTPSAQVTWSDGTVTAISAATTAFVDMVSELAGANPGDAVPVSMQATSDGADGTSAEVRAVEIRLDTRRTGTRTDG